MLFSPPFSPLRRCRALLSLRIPLQKAHDHTSGLIDLMDWDKHFAHSVVHIGARPPAAMCKDGWDQAT